MKRIPSGVAPVLALTGFLISSGLAFAHSDLGESPSEVLHLTGSAESMFGFSSASVGDFNADGYQDFGVSEPLSGFAGANVYWGGPDADSLPDLRLEPSSISDGAFASLIASAGDFNGDGYDDVVASTWGGANRFFVFYGGPLPHSLPDLSLGVPGPFFDPGGVATGDVNHDGYSDLVVGFERYAAPGTVMVYLGGPGVDELPDLELAASPSDLLFPYEGNPVRNSRVMVTDVTGDGVPDVLVGSASGIRVYFGGAGMDGIEDFRLTASVIAGQRIQGSAPAGDVNGDRVNDIMVATADENNLHGRIQIYFGGARMDSLPDITLDGQDQTEMFGPAMVALGDTNGDEFGDIVVGSIFESAGGRVDLFLGGAPMDTIPYSSVTSSVRAFGSILGAADVNGDGVQDAFVSLLCRCTGSDPLGDVLVYDFSTPLPSRAFLLGGDRTLLAGKDSHAFCIRLEPTSNAYDLTEIDLVSVQLTTDRGSIRPIPLEAAKRFVVSDTDRNGVDELPLLFKSSDLGPLFGSIKGRTVVSAQLEGRLRSHRRFAAPLTLTILNTPSGKHGLFATVTPNPMNPAATLTLTMRDPGRVSVRMYDVAGRLARTVLLDQYFGAGTHVVRFDGRDDGGADLGSGVYFYRIDTTEERLTGRVVIMR
jgi:VCBS repeat protein